MSKKQRATAKPRFVYLIEWRTSNFIRAVIVHYSELEAYRLYSYDKPHSIELIGVTLNEPGIILIGQS